jgi:hypothetical protein
MKHRARKVMLRIERDEDEEILKAEQAAHPKGMCDNPHCPCQGRI